MTSDETLTACIRRLVKQRNDCVEKKLFGGTAVLLNGNICCGEWKKFLILRLGDEMARHVLGEEHTRPFDITGKPMRGWVMVEPAGWQDAAGLPDTTKLRRWIAWALEFTEALPAKRHISTTASRAAKRSSQKKKKKE